MRHNNSSISPKNQYIWSWNDPFPYIFQFLNQCALALVIPASLNILLHREISYRIFSSSSCHPRGMMCRSGRTRPWRRCLLPGLGALGLPLLSCSLLLRPGFVLHVLRIRLGLFLTNCQNSQLLCNIVVKYIFTIL